MLDNVELETLTPKRFTLVKLIGFVVVELIMVVVPTIPRADASETVG